MSLYEFLTEYEKENGKFPSFTKIMKSQNIDEETLKYIIRDLYDNGLIDYEFILMDNGKTKKIYITKDKKERIFKEKLKKLNQNLRCGDWVELINLDDKLSNKVGIVLKSTSEHCDVMISGGFVVEEVLYKNIKYIRPTREQVLEFLNVSKRF